MTKLLSFCSLFMSFSDRLEVELEKLQNSSRSADATPFSTPCWNTTSPWDNNGTLQLIYHLYLQCGFIWSDPFSCLIVGMQRHVENQIKAHRALKICAKRLPQLLSCPIFKGQCSFWLVLPLSQLSTATLLFDFWD